MAVKGLDIFKLSPKTNCKECGSPTCMAFCMKVAQGAVSIDKCPHMSDEAKALLSEATAPPMKTITVGAGDNAHKLGGETVLFRHEKTLVNRSLYAVSLCTCMDDATVDEKLADMAKVDYERIGERGVRGSRPRPRREGRRRPPEGALREGRRHRPRGGHRLRECGHREARRGGHQGLQAHPSTAPMQETTRP